MGAYCSIHNDTSDETVMVFVGVNTKVLQPILWSITALATAMSGGVALGSLSPMVTVTMAGEISIAISTLTAAAGGLVTASNFLLDQLQTQLVQDLTQGGYHKCLPGQTYTTGRLSPALNLRAWVVRISRTPKAIIIRRCSASVWTGRVYNILDKTTFPKWTRHETIPIPHRTRPERESTDTTEETFTLLESDMAGMQCTVVERTRKDQSEKEEGYVHVEQNDSGAWIQIDAA